jgi:hypothetical protein
VADDVANAIVAGLPTILTALDIAGVGKNQINESTVTNIDQGLFPTNMNDLTKEQREVVMERVNLERKEGYAEQSKGNSLFDKVYGFFGNVLSTRVDPITQSTSGTDPLSNQYNPAFYQGYTAQMTSGLGNTPQEKSANQSSAGIKDYYNTRNDPSMTNIGNSFVSGNDAYTRTLFGVNAVGDIEAPTIGDYAQLGLTIYDIMNMGIGRGLLFGITNLGKGAKGAGVADDGAKATRSFFSIFKKADKVDDVTGELFKVETRDQVAARWGKSASGATSKVGDATEKLSHGRVVGDKVFDANQGKMVNFKDFTGSPVINEPGKYFRGVGKDNVPQFSIVKDYTKVADNVAAGKPNLSKASKSYYDPNFPATSSGNPPKATSGTTSKAASQGAGTPRTTYKPQTTSGNAPTGIPWWQKWGTAPGERPTLRDIPGNLGNNLLKSLDYGMRNPLVPIMGTLAGVGSLLSGWAFMNFYIGDTLQQASQYNVVNTIKLATPMAFGESIAQMKNQIAFQKDVSYRNAERWVGLSNYPLGIGTLAQGWNTITAGSLEKGVVQYNTYNGVIQTNLTFLLVHGMAYDAKTDKNGNIDPTSVKYRDADAWMKWWETEGKRTTGIDKYGVKGDCEQVYNLMKDKTYGQKAKDDYNQHMNSSIN